MCNNMRKEMIFDYLNKYIDTLSFWLVNFF